MEEEKGGWGTDVVLGVHAVLWKLQLGRGECEALDVIVDQCIVI